MGRQKHDIGVAKRKLRVAPDKTKFDKRREERKRRQAARAHKWLRDNGLV